MRFRNTVVMVIFWLLSQQVGATVAAVFSSTMDLSTSQGTMHTAHMSHHQMGDRMVQSKAMHALSHSSQADSLHAVAGENGMNDPSCCSDECHHCFNNAGGCASFFTSFYPITVEHLRHQPDHFLLVPAPQSTVSSLFRPPIFAH